MMKGLELILIEFQGDGLFLLHMFVDGFVVVKEKIDDPLVQSFLRNHGPENLIDAVFIHTLPVWPILRDSGKNIGHRHDAGTSPYFVSTQVKGVAAAIQLFVMVGSPFGNSLEAADGGQGVIRIVGMTTNNVIFFFGQPAWFF